MCGNTSCYFVYRSLRLYSLLLLMNDFFKPYDSLNHPHRNYTIFLSVMLLWFYYYVFSHSQPVIHFCCFFLWNDKTMHFCSFGKAFNSFPTISLCHSPRPPPLCSVVTFWYPLNSFSKCTHFKKTSVKTYSSYSLMRIQSILKPTLGTDLCFVILRSDNLVLRRTIGHPDNLLVPPDSSAIQHFKKLNEWNIIGNWHASK